MISDAHKELCGRMMAPDSDRVGRIWEILCDETDAKLLLAMPGNLEELAKKMNLSPDDIKKRIKELFFRGVVFETEKPQGIIYKAPRHLVQLHDASVQWPKAPEVFYRTWNDFMELEYPKLLEMLMAAGVPAFMRTIPASGIIDDIPGVLPYENVDVMIENADKIAVVRCPCRLSVKACDADVETCVQFNRGAYYNIKRGTGREIEKEEARRIIRESEEAGLVHTVETKADMGNVLCNCCTCCCAILVPYLKGGEFTKILNPSRFMAEVDDGGCISDGLCVDLCPVNAISMETGAEAEVDEEICIGCGLCVKVCTVEAIEFKLTRPADFI